MCEEITGSFICVFLVKVVPMSGLQSSFSSGQKPRWTGWYRRVLGMGGSVALHSQELDQFASSSILVLYRGSTRSSWYREPLTFGSLHLPTPWARAACDECAVMYGKRRACRQNGVCITIWRLKERAHYLTNCTICTGAESQVFSGAEHSEKLLAETTEPQTAKALSAEMRLGDVRLGPEGHWMASRIIYNVMSPLLTDLVCWKYELNYICWTSPSTIRIASSLQSVVQDPS